MPYVHRALTASAVLLTAAAATPAVAQDVIDQQQPIALSYLILHHINNWTAQAFTPTATNVSGVGAFLRSDVPPGVTAPGSVTFALWSGNPAIGASQQLASQTVSYNLGLGGAWTDAFWSPVAVIPGQTYWLLVGGGPSFIYATGGDANSYANGGAYFNGSTDIRSQYTSYTANYDLTFRTYTSVGVTATPEPGTWALLGTGLVGLSGLGARRRRRPTA